MSEDSAPPPRAAEGAEPAEPAPPPAAEARGRSQTEPSSAAARPQSPQTYEAAAARVEEIIRRLDSGEASLSETLELVREGKHLIELCARELQAVGGALEELR